MYRVTICAAAAAAFIALTAPAQAGVANAGLSAHLARSSAMPAQPQAEQVHYRYRRYNRYRYRHGYRHHRRHRHCWNQRIRVRVPGGYFVWRTHRRCGWRYW